MALTTCMANYVPAFAQDTVSNGGTVYISISDDDAYVRSDVAAHQDEVMAYIPVSIDAVAQTIDLEEYGYGDFLYDADDDGSYETTLLQGFLYVLENYYSEGTSQLNITGSSGSTYMQNGFWGHDENLTYYVNGAYPLESEAWGATSDHIVLHNGDFIDVTMYSDWDFYTDAEAGYHYFTDTNGAISHEFQATAGRPLQVGYARTATDWNGTYETSLIADNADIYIASELYADEADAVETEDGEAEITFEEPGTYYLWTYGGEGASGSIVSSPAYAKVTVEASPVVETTVNAVIRSQVENAYLAPVDMETVSSLEAERFGFTDEIDGVSALDVLVKSHEDIFGEDFTAETTGDYLVVSSTGWISKIFGEETSANGFLVNAGYPNDGTPSSWGGYNGTMVTNTAIADEDIVDFFVYQDADTYSDYMTYVDVPEEAEANSQLELTVKGLYYMNGYNYADAEAMEAAARPLKDAGIAWVNYASPEIIPVEDAITDTNGKVTITVPDEAGYYLLSAISNPDEEVYCILNPSVLHVTEPDVPVTRADVTVRSQMQSTYLNGINETVSVASNLAESYGFTDALPGEVTALDALVKAHELIFGEDFTAETAGEFLEVPSSGFVTKLFGEETFANGFLVNEAYPNDGTESSSGGYNGTTVTTTALADGDVVDFFTYGDTSFWSDTYSFTEVPESVVAGTEFDVNVSGTMVMMGYLYADADEFREAAEAIEDAALAWVDPSTGEVLPIVYEANDELVVTDEDGAATITAPEEPGTYCLTAISNEDADVYVIMNPVAVTVEDAPAPVEVTATIKYNSPSDGLALYAIDDTEKENNLLAEATPEGTTYTVTLEAGQYIAEAFTGEISNGTIVLDVDADNKAFEIFTVTAYCSTSGWTYGTDYTIEKLTVISGGDKATVIRDVTMGDSSTAGRKTFLVLMGDTYSFYGTPMGERAETFVPTYKNGTVTATNYTTASFTMSAKTGLSVTVPYADTDSDGQNDYILEVGQMFNYYIYTYMDPLTDVIDAEAGTETQTFETAKSAAYFYRVTNPLNEDAVTYGNYITCSADANTATVTTADMMIGDASLDKSTVIDDFSANTYDTGDIYMNINEKGYLNMASGSTFNLYPFRNWLAIESISNAKVIEPDFHVEVIGDAVSVAEKTENNESKHSFEVKAEHAGTAIVLVTYDAMFDAIGMGSKPIFSAIWPENTGVFVVTVDGATGFDTGMTINEGLNKEKLSGDKYDADLDVLYYTGNAGAEYTFTPPAGTEVTMAVGQIAGGKMTFGGFSSEGVTVNKEGSVTLSGMTEGKTIVKLTKGGLTEYQVLKTRKLSYTITNQDGAVIGTDAGIGEGVAIKANDTLKFVFDTVYIPANKLSGIYNMSGTIRLIGEDNTTFNGTANQYLFASTPAAQTVTVKIPKFWTGDTYTLSGLVAENGFGSTYGSHRLLTYEGGKSPNFTAVMCAGSFGSLPAIVLPIQETQFLDGAFTFVDEKGTALPANVGTIILKDYENAPVNVAEDGTFKASAGTYSYVVNASGYEYNYGTVTLTEDGDNTFEIVLQTSSEGAWDGYSMTQPQQDEDGTYLISNGAELKWFQNEVTVNKNKTANAKLTADINLAKYPWAAIGSTSYQMGGTFDGAGHEIYNLYCTGTGTLALFGCITGTVKDLTVSGDVVGTSSNLAGIVAYAQGQNASNPCHIINVVNNVNVTQNNTSASAGTMGGIAGYTYYAVIENCTNNGTISTNSTSTSANGYGGIVGYMMNYQPSAVIGCKNTGDITGRKNVGGIVGYTGGNKPVIESCYNTGAVSGNSYVAGIVGDLQGAAYTHGYNTGSVTAETQNGAQPIAGDSKSGFNATDAYYLNTIAATADCGTALTADELAGRSIEGFGTCCEGNPALLWEDAQFHQKDEGVETAPTCTEEGYTTYTCPNCKKTYTADYVPASGHTPVISEQHIGYGYGTCSVCGIEMTVWDDERLQVLSYSDLDLSAISMTDQTDYPWKQIENGLMSGNKGIDSSTSATDISFTLTDTATVSFDYSVSSEARYDKLTISLDNNGTTETIADAISGNENGTFTREMPAGTYTLKLSFYKDSSSASGEDCGRITNFKIQGDHEFAIIQQPVDIESASKGDTLSYSVVAKNAVSYQWYYTKNGTKWYKSTANGNDTPNVSLVLSSSNMENSYRCKVTGKDGTVLYTDTVTLLELNEFAITSQPVNWDAADGKDASFTVEATGAESFKWYYSKDGGTKWYASSLTAETTATSSSIALSLAASNAGNIYRCKVTDPNGNTLYSNPVGFTGVPAITAQPENVDYTAGQIAEFTVEVTEPDNCTYQWYYSKDGGNSWYKSTATGAQTAALSVTMKASSASMIYRCRVSANGMTITSESAGFNS